MQTQQLPESDGFRIVLSPAVIPFEPRDPAILAARKQLREMLATMAAEPAQLLHGVIDAGLAETTDLDNALLYNIGGSVAAATRHGVILERAPSPSTTQAIYRYRLASSEGFLYYRQGDVLAEMSEVVLDRFPARWLDIWAAATSSVRVCAAPSLHGPLLLDLRLSGPGSPTANGQLVKTLVDGVLTALHAHGNPGTVAEGARRMSEKVGMSEESVAARLLDQRNAVLGVVPNLISFRGTGVQCRPHDHRVGALKVRLEHNSDRWTLDGVVARAAPRHSG
jgi:hypothetical protein